MHCLVTHTIFMIQQCAQTVYYTHCMIHCIIIDTVYIVPNLYTIQIQFLECDLLCTKNELHFIQFYILYISTYYGPPYCITSTTHTIQTVYTVDSRHTLIPVQKIFYIRSNASSNHTYTRSLDTPALLSSTHVQLNSCGIAMRALSD